MRILLYAFQSALRSLWLEKWINLLTILSIAIGLLILGGFVVLTMNMDSFLERWSMSFGMVVYLDEDATKETEASLSDLFQRDPDIVRTTFISSEQALDDLRKTLGDRSSVLEEFRENPLPSSYELRLKRELLDPQIVEAKAREIGQMEGVEEVQYGVKWLSSLNTLSNVMKISVLFIGSAVFIAITFITYSTIKIFFFRRKEEIDTLKLLGATRTFIRLPFLLEGIIMGLLGGALSSLGLYTLYSVAAQRVPQVVPSIASALVALPVETYMSVPLVGVVMSFIGSLIAVGKIRY